MIILLLLYLCVIPAEGCGNPSCTSIQNVMGQSKLIVDASNGTVEVTQHLSQQGGCSMPHIMLCADVTPLNIRHGSRGYRNQPPSRIRSSKLSVIESSHQAVNLRAQSQSEVVQPRITASVKLDIIWGGVSVAAEIGGRGKPTCAILPVLSDSDLTLRFSAGSAAIDNLHFYCHLHKLNVYGAGNKALGRRNAIVRLNSLLPEYNCLPNAIT